MRTGKEWKYWIIERGAVDTTVAPERCTSVYVLTAVRNVKFRLSPRRDDLSTAVSASRSAGRREGTRKLGRASSATGFRDRLRILFFFRFIHYILGSHVIACVYTCKVVCIKDVILFKKRRKQGARVLG